MAINACTINSFTIDARRCRDKFADLIPILHPPVTTGGGFNGWVSAQVAASRAAAQAREAAAQRQQQRWQQPEAPRYEPTELEQITVTAKFMELSGTDTQKVVARPDLVTVTDIHIVPIEKA